MTSEKQFYVYVHRKSTDGSVFYVGKGQGNRSSHRKGRNIYWHRVANKYGFTSHIVMTFEKEACSFSLERALIKFYGRKNLCNLTDGGDGVSGFVMSDDAKLRISNALIGIKRIKTIKQIDLHRKKMIGRKLTDDHKKKVSGALSGVYKGGKIHTFYHDIFGVVSATTSKMRRAYGANGNICGVVSGRIISSEGWSLLSEKDNKGHKSGHNHHSFNPSVYTFHHDTLGKIEATPLDFSLSTGINLKYVNRIVSGVRKKCMGWTISK